MWAEKMSSQGPGFYLDGVVRVAPWPATNFQGYTQPLGLGLLHLCEGAQMPAALVRPRYCCLRPASVPVFLSPNEFTSGPWDSGRAQSNWVARATP